MHDLRLPALALAAWCGGLVPLLAGVVPGRTLPAVLTVLAAGAALVLRRLPPASRTTLVAAVTLFVAVGVVAVLRQEQTARNPVASLAAQRAVVELAGTVGSDPRPAGDRVVVELTVSEVEGRGRVQELRTTVLVLGDEEWLGVPLGAAVRTGGRLSVAADPDLAALLVARDAPTVLREPDVWWRAAGAVRAAVRESVRHRPADQAALVPAIVDGDDAGLSEGLSEDFRATGLTHLLAVSGTNLTLMLGFLLALARWCGVRGRGLLVVGAAAVAGFVLLARTEPSVVRAAAMGSVGLLAMTSNGRQRALRGLGAAVVGLLLLDPAMARSVGFALSVLATAGILLLGPSWRDALACWMPRWLAEAVAVSSTAQLACTPVVAAISGQVSLVAVAANLVVEPVVGPATVLGLAGGLLTLVWAPSGRLVGTLASWCVGWIALVARRGADLPAADVGWSTGVLPILVLAVLSGLVALGAPRLLRSRWKGLTCAGLLAGVVVLRPPTPGWPPHEWVLVACDVGQGDALVVRAAPDAALVVDAGPDPAAVDRCLDDLDVTHVPLVVLTHFHADHVDGLSGVLSGRRVDAVETSMLADPPAAAAEVAALAATAGATTAPAAYGGARRFGDVVVQVLWPRADGPTRGPGDGSTANDASVVLLVEAQGLRLLLTGDLEPPGQAALARSLPGLAVDVLKVPHHGSRHQDHDWLLSLDADVAVTSVGKDNDYGHPAGETLDPLADAGIRVLRTDRDGTVAVVAGPEGPEVAAR